MHTGAGAQNGSKCTLSAAREALAEFMSGVSGASVRAEDIVIPHRTADAAAALSKPGLPEEELKDRLSSAPLPEAAHEVRVSGGKVLFRISDRFLEEAAAERGKLLPEPVLPDEIAIPANGAAPDADARAYALSLAISAHRSGRPYRADKAHAALLSCLVLNETGQGVAAAVRAVIRAFDDGLFGGEAVLFMAKSLSCGEKKE